VEQFIGRGRFALCLLVFMEHTENLKIRVNQNLKDLIINNKKEGESMSAVVRRILDVYFSQDSFPLLEKKMQKRKTAILKMIEILGGIENGNAKIIWFLSNIANNINQIAYQFNRNIVSDKIINELFDEIKKLDEFSIKFRKKIDRLNESIADLLITQKEILENESK
jgi:hypothetical protein